MSRWNDVPFSDLLNKFFARKPSEVDGVANISAYYYRKKLFRLILARFEFGSLPDTWEVDYFLDHLFGDGLIGVTDTEAGLLALKCGATGIGIFDNPTQLQFANPILGSFRRTIGEDCEFIRISYDFSGVWYLVDRYATMLAMCDSSVAVNLMNTKVSWVFGATSKQQAETFKKLYDDVSMGKPAVFTTNSNSAMLKENMFVMPAKQNFIADDVQLLKRKIINEFLTDIGINNTNLDKRERLTDDEVNANDVEVRFNIQHWYDNITDGIIKVNKMFNLDITCRIRDFDSEVREVVNELTEPS